MGSRGLLWGNILSRACTAITESSVYGTRLLVSCSGVVWLLPYIMRHAAKAIRQIHVASLVSFMLASHLVVNWMRAGGAIFLVLMANDRKERQHKLELC